MNENPGSISQSNTGSMSGGMQAAIGNQNSQMMKTQAEASSKTVTKEEVVSLLTEISEMLQSAGLSEADASKAAKYLEAAKTETEEDEPDKQLISKNLERVTKTLEEAGKSVDAGKSLFEKVVPLLVKVAGWLGTAAGTLWGLLP